MRTLLDIPEEDLKLLNKLSDAEEVSRAELVRRAIFQYLKAHRSTAKAEAFGLWADAPEDGRSYQRKIRREWGT